MNRVQRELFEPPVPVVEIHDVVGILNAAIGTRPRLRFEYQLPPLGIGPKITLEVGALVTLVVTPRQPLAAFTTIRMADALRAVFKVELFRGLDDVTAGAGFMRWVLFGHGLKPYPVAAGLKVGQKSLRPFVVNGRKWLI